MSVSKFDLKNLFDTINREHFDGLLAPCELRWNSRLRTTAGRFIPGVRQFWRFESAVIEVASYLTEEEDADWLIWDTVAHEMIHYWLWSRGLPYGHTEKFLKKMKEMGVSRYNPVPKRSNYRYIYQCPGCRKEYPARRKWKGLACADCCKAYSAGQFSESFRLVYVGEYSQKKRVDHEEVVFPICDEP